MTDTWIADVRPTIVEWAKWGVAHRASFTYTETAGLRMADVHRPGSIPDSCDCSAWVTYCYSWSHAPDPNGQNFDGEGYTGTLLSHGTKIPESQLMPGDVIVFVTPQKTDGVHAVLVTEVGADPVCSSMGKQGDPSFVKLSVLRGLGTPVFLRFSTKNTTPKPVAPPTAAQLSANHLVAVNAAEIVIAKKNGWPIRSWNGKTFPLVTAATPAGPRYANVDYQKPKPKPSNQPTAAELAAAKLVHLATQADIDLAVKNGWPLFGWNGTKFVAWKTGLPSGAARYASVNYTKKKP